MEARKYQLQQQIIDALRANDDDLYALLKSQWAHRFGVESLEELNNLDSNQVNESLNKEENLKIEKFSEKHFEDDQISSKPNTDLLTSKEKQQMSDNSKDYGSISSDLQNSSPIKQDKFVDNEKENNKSRRIFAETKNMPNIEPLIPIPPKPKYGYLKRWLLSRF